MKNINLSGTPVLIISCDGYSDLWRPFFYIFRKRWPDCPFPVYLGTNFKQFEQFDVNTIAIGEDLNWASNVLKMLDRLNSEYVYIFLEDFLITEDINTEAILKFSRIAVEKNVGCFRLAAGLPLAFPPSAPVPGVEGVGSIDKDELYRVSAQVAFWRVETLRKVLINGMNPWQFEEIGTQISWSIEDPFWGIYKPLIEYSQCVEKGKWKPEGLEICKKAGVPVNDGVRQQFSDEELRQHLYNVEKNSYIPLQIQTAIRNFTQNKHNTGLNVLAPLIKKSPFNLKFWGILFTGLVYPKLFSIIQKIKLQQKIKSLSHNDQ